MNNFVVVDVGGLVIFEQKFLDETICEKTINLVISRFLNDSHCFSNDNQICYSAKKHDFIFIVNIPKIFFNIFER